MKDGFVKIAASSPVIRVADCDFNASLIIDSIEKDDALGVKVLAFPELSITGVTCGDLIRHKVILDGAITSLTRIIQATAGKDMLVFVGLPFAYGAKLLSVAAVVCNGELLGLVPRENVKGSCFTEYEGDGDPVSVGPYESFISPNTLFTHSALPELSVAVELGNDLNEPISPACAYALEGATLIIQMASFPQTVFSDEEHKADITSLSRRLFCSFLLAAPGRGESTTDNSYSGLCMIAEYGELLAMDEGADTLAVSEVDVQRLVHLRRVDGGFDVPGRELCVEFWGGELSETTLTRHFSKHPHLPDGEAALAKYCDRMLEIQVSGLVKRMKYAGLDHCVVGISGGVDSTLAVLVSSMAIRQMGLPSTNVIACTMPCFGTSSRTKSNAVIVAEQIGAEVRVIDISKSVYQHFDDIGHAYDDYSVAFENAQARERTQILMDISNKCNGLDVGTEDLSEYIDGWCTYNGDHTSMYDVNIGLTKTQVRAAVAHIAAGTADKILKAALYDVLDCPVTPELLPIHDDLIEQKSEDAVGSYSLQDFFTHKILICGFDPIKTIRLAKAAYADEFSETELIKWLKSYCKRLFTQQFKRSCLMDGPSVEAFSVSPRTGLHMPSDGESALFLKMLEDYECCH